MMSDNEFNQDSFDIDEVLNSSDSQADHLHGVVQSKLQTNSENWTRNDFNHISKLASHPNTTTEHLSAVYSHFTPRVLDNDLSWDSSGAISDIFRSGKANPKDAEHFLEATLGNHNNYKIEDAHTAASGVAGISTDFLQNLALKTVNEPEFDSVPEYKNLPAGFLHETYLQREDSNPTEATLNEQQEAHNNKMTKLDELFYKNIAEANHTQEELTQTADFFSKPVDKLGVEHHNVKSAIKDFLEREDLGPEHIEKIFNAHADKDPYDRRTVDVKNALKNPNAPVSLVAKVALSEGDVYPDSFKNVALTSPRLPEETALNIISNYDNSKSYSYSSYSYNRSPLDLMASNPSIKPEMLQKIYDAGNERDKIAAIQSKNASVELVQNYWETSDKSNEKASTLLSAPNVNPTILAEIAGKTKKQELSIEALNHENSDISVINAGLKRRAIKVQEAAAAHPLVAKQQVMERLTDGRLRPEDFLFDKKLVENVGGINEDHIKVLDVKHAEIDPDMYTSRSEAGVKEFLSTDKRVPKDIRERNKKELLDSVLSGKNEYVKDTVIDMAHNGDIDAQNTVLESERLLGSIDFRKEKLSTGFLDKASGQESIENRDLLEMAQNPNASESLFDKVFFDKDINLGIISAEWGQRKKGEISTVYDQRYKNLNEEEKALKFSAMIESGSDELVYAAALSEQTPKEQFNKAISHFASISDVSELAQDLGSDLPVSGYEKLDKSNFNLAIDNKFGHQFRDEAFKRFNISNEDHVDSILNYMDSKYGPESPEWDFGDIDTNGFSKLVKGKIKLNRENPNATKIVTKALELDGNLGGELAYYQADPHRDGLLKEDIDKLGDLFTQTSEFEKDINGKWISAIESGLSSKKVGDLDFLYDFPGDKDRGYELRSAALRAGILSDDIISQRALTESPDDFEDALRGMPRSQKDKTIRNLIGAETADPETIKRAMKHFVISTVKTQNYGRGALSKSEVESSMGNVRVVATGLIRHKSSDGLMSMVSTLVDRDNVEKFTKPQSKKAIENIVSVIDTSDLDLTEKNKLKLGIWQELIESDNQYALPPSMIKSIVESSVKENDVDTIISMNEVMDKPPASIKKAIKGYLENPEGLTVEQLSSLAYSFDIENATHKSAKNILDSLANKIDTAENQEEALGLIKSRVDLSSKLLDSKRSESIELAVNIIQSHLNHSDGGVQDAALTGAKKILGSAEDLRHQVETFKLLPQDLPPVSSATALMRMTLSPELLENEEILSTPDSTWKTGLYAYNAFQLNNSGASYLVDRTISSQDYGDHQKEKIMNLLFENTKVDDNIKMNLFRSLDIGQKRSVMKKAISVYDDFFSGGAHLGLSDLISDTEQKVKNLFNSDVNDFESLAGALNQISDIEISRLNLDQGQFTDTKFEEGVEAVNNYVDRGLSIANSIYAKALSRIENSSEQISESEFRGIMSSMFDYQHETLKASSQRDGLEMLHVIGFGRNLYETYKEKNGQELAEKHLLGRDYGSDFRSMDDYHEQNRNLIVQWNKNTVVKDDDWQKILEKEPSVITGFHKSQSISGAALKAINYKDFLASDDPEISRDVNDFISARVREWLPRIRKSDHQDGIEFTKNLIKDHFNANPGSNMGTEKVALKAFNVFQDKLSENDVSEILNHIGRSGAKSQLIMHAAANNSGGPEIVNKAIAEGQLKSNYDSLISIARKSKLNEDNTSNLISSFKDMGRNQRDLFISLASNQSVDVNTLSYINKEANQLGRHERRKIKEIMQKHPNVDKKLFKQLYEDTKGFYEDQKTIEVGTQFNPAYLNRNFGGDLFRSRPVVIPDGQPETVSRESSKIPKVAVHSKARDLLQEATKSIPAEGISYADFKKINKQLAERKEVKDIFMSAKKQFVTPEVMSRAIESAGGDYHLTYASWSSMQRHMEDAPNGSDPKFTNLVVQLNTGKSMEKQLAADPKLWSFFQMVQKAGNRTAEGNIGSHPVTPHLAGWIRIDTSGGKDGWVIEEFQSDFSSSLRGQIKDIKRKYPDGLELDGQFYHPDELDKHAKQVEKIISGWHEAAVKAAKNIAKKNGAKQLFLHGEGVRSTMSFGANKRENPVWMQHMYSRHPKKNGWQQCDYTDYPNWSKSLKKEAEQTLQGTKCWKIKL